MPASLALKITAQDQASKPLGGIAGALRGLEGAASAPARALGGLTSILGQIGLAGLGVQAITGLAGAFRGLGESLGVGLNVELENTTAAMQALTKDAEATKSIMAAVRAEADKTPFAFQEMAKATAGLMPAAKQAQVPLMDLVKTAEILAASNPAQGLEGAAFALREAVSGDFTSIIERFNLPRQYINQLKDEGVPALEAVQQAMKNMGYDADLVSGMAQTLTGRWSTFTDTLDGVRQRISQPIFDRLKSGLEQAQKWFDENRETIDTWSARVAAAIGLAIDATGALARGFASGLGATLDIVRNIGRAIWEALSWLNPFAAHSPSLVSQIESGVLAINAGYARLGASQTQLDGVASHIRGLSRDMLTFTDAGRDINPVADAIRRFSDAAGNVKNAVKPAEQAISALKEAVSRAKDELNRLTSTPLMGTKAFGDQAFALEQQMAGLQRRMNDMRLSGASQEALKPLEEQMDRLRIQADNIRLDEQLQLDPLRRKLQDLAHPTAEAWYIDLATGIGRARGEVERLTPELEIVEEAYQQIKEQVEAAKGRGGGGGAGGSAGLGGALKLPAIDTSELDSFKEKVEQARQDLVSRFNEISGNIQRALEPVTRTWNRIAAGWVEGGLMGALREVGNIAGEIGRWLGEQWSQIDWRAVWSNAVTVGSAIAEGVGHIWGSITAWLIEEWRQIDWGEIVKRQEQGDAAVAAWIRTWEAKESGAATADWLIQVMRAGIADGGKSLNERAKDLIRWFPQNLIGEMFSSEMANSLYGKIAEWLGGLFARAMERLREHWRTLWGNLPGANDVFPGGIPVPTPGQTTIPIPIPIGPILPITASSSLQPVNLTFNLDGRTVTASLLGNPQNVAQLAAGLQQHSYLQAERY